MQEFNFFLPTKVYFGKGTLKKVGEETAKLGGKAMVVTGRTSARKTGILQRVESSLKKEKIKTILFEQVEPNPSFETAKRGAEVSKREKVEVIVALGGGSPLDAAKAIAVLSTNSSPLEQYIGQDKVKKPLLPLIAIPTTAGTGSEVTKYIVLTDKKRIPPHKEVIGDAHLFPKIAILDPELTLSLPPSITADTGVDALSHAIEGFSSNRAQPLADLLALKSINLIFRYLPEAINNPYNLEARSSLLYASFLAGIVIAQTGTIIVHAMGYRLTSEFGIPHGRANGILLPWVYEFNLSANYSKFALLTRELGEKTENLSEKEEAQRGVFLLKSFLQRVNMPRNLKEKNIKKDKIEEFAKEVMQNKRKLEVNPRKVILEDIIEIYEKALSGKE